MQEVKQRYEFAVLRWHESTDHGVCQFSHQPDWYDLEAPLVDALRRLGDAGFALRGAVLEGPVPTLYFQRPLSE